MSYEHYASMADLLDYPGPEFITQGQGTVNALRQNYPEIAHSVELFLNALPKTIIDLQELHTRTFDVQAITTLSTGYILFGDDYKRGALLSNLNREHLNANNDCRGELADYLPNVLRLLPKLEDMELVNELVTHILLPSVMLMIKDFEPERIKKKNENYQKHYKTLIDSVAGYDAGVYCLMLNAVLQGLNKDFQVSEIAANLSEWSNRPQTIDFLQSVEKEIDIEKNANPLNSGCDV